MESATAAPARQKAGRRQYLIDRGFQLKYSFILVVVSSAISLFFGAMMFQAHRDASEMLDLGNLDPGLSARIAQVDTSLLWVVGAVTVLMAVTLGLLGVMITHRVAGPIFVFSQYMAVLGRGRYPLLRPLRKGDELKEFYDVFNESVAAMREQDRLDGEALAKMAGAMKAVGTGELGELAEQARAMSERLLDAAVSHDPATPGQKAEATAAAA